MTSRVAIITPDAAFEEKLRTSVSSLPSSAVRRWKDEYLRIDPSKVVAEMADEGVGVVCLGPGLPVDTMLELAAAFDRDHPEQCVLMLAEPTVELWRQAAPAGVRDVVSPRADLVELSRAVARAVETAERRRANVIGDADPRRPASRVVTVLSPKGGSGKTTLATNLSVGLAGAMPGKVAVVDLDVHFGDVAAALQLSPSHTIRDLAIAGAVDTTMAKVFLSSHASGLYVLCAPESPAEGDEVTYEHAAQAVGLLAQEFPVVVVDTAAGLDERTLAAIEVSTDLVLVATTDVSSVRSLRKLVEALDRLSMTAQQRHFVLNRADARVGLETPDIETAVGMKTALSLPSSRAVPLSMNLGTPVILSEPRSPVARQLQRLVEQFTAQSPDSHLVASGPSASRRRWR
jgi:pilus assembly protein CpaE